MATFRWPGSLDPFAPLRHMQRELERLVGREAGVGQRIGGGVYPPVNVLDGPDELVVQCEVAGLTREDIDISITGETLVIKGCKSPPAEQEQLRYERQERGFGEFSRTIILPDQVDSARAEAKLDSGILTIRLAKSEAAKPRQIAVE